jgi:hypothetical protein
MALIQTLARREGENACRDANVACIPSQCRHGNQTILPDSARDARPAVMLAARPWTEARRDAKSRSAMSDPAARTP